ncbi:MAG: EAL domain-containing protein [Phascolarctobacterium sp.]|nr:EAL domain-containing protein [Phascolarctobacterium sp.]
MYHSSLNIYLINQTEECVLYLKDYPYPKNYRVNVYADTTPMPSSLKKADVLLVNLPTRDILDFLTLYKQEGKKGSKLIFNTTPQRRNLILNSPDKDLVYDLWPMAMTINSFSFGFKKLFANIHRDNELWQKEQCLNTVINSTDSLIWFKDKQGAHLRVNDNFCKAVNKTHEQIQGRGHFYIWDLTPEDYQAGEYICMESEIEVMDKGERCLFDEQVKIGDELHYLKTYKSPLFDLDGTVMGTCGVAADISNEIFYRQYSSSTQKEIAELKHYVYVDNLTGGDTYLLFKSKVRSINRNGSIIAINIHDFKTINTICGTSLGDIVLKRIWMILKDLNKPEDLVARVGADSYVVYTIDDPLEGHIYKQHEFVARLQDLSHELDIPSLIPYIGTAPYNPNDDVEIVYSRACIARNLLKNRPGVIGLTYTNEMGNNAKGMRSLEAAFDDALADNRIELWLQPKFSPKTNTVVGAEALVRWRGKDSIIIPPIKFISLLETNGKIKELDEYIYRKVCCYQKRALTENGKLIPISVNLSRVSLFSNSIVRRYAEIANEFGISRKYLPIEITESATINDVKSAETIRRFHLEKFPIHLDDFGAGYSSLANLTSSSFNTIKLDKTLIDNIAKERGAKLLKHIVSLAKDLNISVTAEGVEEASQKDFLTELGVDDIQGYYYSKPIPEEEFWEKYGK